jgi:hypothetical protein
MDLSEKTLAEMARGAAAAPTHSECPRSPEAARSKIRIDPDLDEEKSAFASFPIIEEVDPNVTIPADVRASIERAEAAAAQARQAHPTKNQPPDLRTAVTDQDVQDELDRHLCKLELVAKGKRQQPPMVNRLRVVSIIVERAIADGIPFAVGPNSKMNHLVRERLNAKAARTIDPRKSRQKQIGPGAVRALLRQIRALRTTGD